MHKKSTSLIDMKGKDGFILMDGAMGTELERRGVVMGSEAWSAVAMQASGDIVTATHRDYLDSGANLHIVNSFGLARHVLEPAGLGKEFEYFNIRAVELFNEAVSQSGIDRNEMWCAGSLSTYASDSDRSRLPRGKILLQNNIDQAAVLIEAGVDLLVLEMLCDIEISKAMLHAAEQFGVPVIAGFTCSWGDHGNTIEFRDMGLEPLSLEYVLPRFIDAINSEEVILSIMHSQLDVIDPALDILQKFWDGPIAVYPNSGDFDFPVFLFDTVCSAETFVSSAQKWIQRGVHIVGGCCGIGPDHIRSLAEMNVSGH